MAAMYSSDESWSRAEIMSENSSNVSLLSTEKAM